MRSTVVQKPVASKNHSDDARHTDSVKRKSSGENGTAAGVPVYLQRAAATPGSRAFENQQTCSKCAAAPHDKLSPLQAKLTVSARDDPYEREADAVADHVVNGKTAPAITPVPATGLGRVALMAADEEQSEPEPEEATSVQAKAGPPGNEEAEAEEEPLQAQLIQRQPEEEAQQEEPSEAQEETSSELQPSQSEQGEIETEEGSLQTQLIQRQSDEEAQEETASEAQQSQSEQGGNETEEEPLQAQLIQRQSDEEAQEESASETQPSQTEEGGSETEEEPLQTQLIQRQSDEEAQEETASEAQQSPSEEGESETEEPLQTLLIQRQNDEEAQEETASETQVSESEQESEPEEAPLQQQRLYRQAEEEEEAAAESKEEPVQAKPVTNADVQSSARQSEQNPLAPAQQAQRKCKNCEGLEQKPVQTKAQSGPSIDATEVQAKHGNTTNTVSTGAVSGALAQSGTGATLNTSVKQAMEHSTGLDFSAVRVHSDSASQRANRALKARAFAHGLDIWLGRGESQHDRRLMAHELTHIVQQNSSGGRIQKLLRKSSDPRTIEDSETVSDGIQHQVNDSADQANVVQASPAVDRPATDNANDEASSESDLNLDHKAEAEAPDELSGLGDKAGMDDPGLSRPPIDQDPNAAQVEEELPAKEPPVQRKAALAMHPDPHSYKAAKRLNGAAFARVERTGRAGRHPQPIAKRGRWLKHAFTSVLQRWQRAPGHFDGLIQRQDADCPPVEPVPEVEVIASPATPRQDPAFNKTRHRVKNRAKNQARHGTGDEKSSSANAAAEVKAGEKKSHGQKDQVGEMAAQAQKPPAFDKQAFVSKVLEQVKKIAPKTLDDFMKFARRGKADDVKAAVTGQVKQSQKASQDPLAQAAKKDPGTGTSPRTATALKIEPPGKRPGSVRSDRAMPPPRTDSEVDFKTDTIRTENILKEACITREYMDKHNDPVLKQGAEAQDQLKQATSESPQNYRDQEASVLAGARSKASSQGKQGVAGMFGERSGKFDQVGNDQQRTKSENEGKRDAAAKEIDGIFTTTQTNVQTRLKKLDKDVETTFDRDAGKASAKFQAFVHKKAKSLQKKWYETVAEKVSSALFGPPPKAAKSAYESGRRTFVEELTAVIGTIAGLVDKGLADARKIVDKGKRDVQEKLDSLGGDLDDFKQQKAEQMADRFRSLEGEITKKQSEIVTKLATRYVNAVKGAKKAEKSIRDQYKNFVERAEDVYNKVKDAVLGWIEKLKAVVGGAAKRIIRQPGKFLRNLGAGIVQGFTMFMGNIGENIKGAVVEWLTGNMGSAGISLPKTFDARGIIGFLLELVGLGVANIKNIARKVFGRRAVSLIEKGVAGAEKIKRIFDILAKDGPSGLFQFLAGEFEKMKEQVLGKAGKAIAEGLVIAGIKKALGIISGLVSGGVGTVITIVATIIDVVLWIRDNAARIAELVSTIAGMAMAILNGQVAAVAAAINTVLKRLLPLVLGFVGALVGIGRVVSKIQKIFKAIKKPATKAITKLFTGFKNLVKKLIAKIKKKLGKGKRKRKAKGKEKKLSPRKVRRLILSALSKPAKAQDPAQAIAETKTLAANLKSKYQPKLKKGTIKITLLDKTPEGVEKDGDIDFDVALSPGTKGARKVKTTLERKFRRQIARCHSVAKADVKRLVGAIDKKRSNIKKWDTVKGIISQKPPLKNYTSRPVYGHKFGQQVVNLVQQGVKQAKITGSTVFNKVRAGINAGSGFYAKPKALLVAHIFNDSASKGKIVGAVSQATTESFKDKPAEPYNRKKHYGRTPTGSDRRWFEQNRSKAVNAAKRKQKKATGDTQWVLDHEPPLVTRYYKGAAGEKPGFKMTAAERRASGGNRSRMTPQPRNESDKQGGEMAAKSSDYRKEFFGK